jgi:hypothetical protein
MLSAARPLCSAEALSEARDALSGAVLIGIACAAIARALMTHDSIPGPADAAAGRCACLLLQSILGYEGLSAGVWYIAIDFQLFALLLGILWLARGIGRGGGRGGTCRGALLVTTLALASLYTSTAMGLGQLGRVLLRCLRAGHAELLGNNPQRGFSGWLLLILVPLVVSALLLDYRSTHCRGAGGGADAWPGAAHRLLETWPTVAPDCLSWADFLLGLSGSLSRSAW